MVNSIGSGGGGDRVDAEAADGALVERDLKALSAGPNLEWTRDDDGRLLLTATDTQSADTHIELQTADGTTVLADPDALRAGDNLSATDNGDGTVTLSATDTVGMTTADKQAMSTHPVPMTELASGDYVDFPVHVPSGKTLKVWKWGARTDGQTTPNGLKVGLYDFAGATYVASAETAHTTGAPLASFDGPGDLALRLENSTGGTLNAGADFSVTVES